MPKMGDTMAEGTISKWYKNVGDIVKEGEALAEIETEKASIDIEAFESGPLTRIIVNVGETVPVGTPIAEIGGTGSAADVAPAPAEPQPAAVPSQPAPAPPAPAAVPPPPSAAAGESRIKASPLARSLAKAHAVDLRLVRGTGPGGRVVRDDIVSFVQGLGRPVVPTGGPHPMPAAGTAPAGEVWKPAGKASRMRQVIARRLTDSKQQVPHFYVTMEVDMAAAMALREGLNARGEGYPKISPNDLIVKAVADSLRAQPQMRVAWGGEGILATDSVNVGVAVALEDGLIVPVVRDADAKTVTQISGEIRALAEKARAGRLLPDDYAGGTFTVTNLGMFGVEDFSAIINPPEPAILAVSAIAEKPVVVDGKLAIGTRMTMTISGDHRAIDGATAARFLAEVRRRLETPGMLVG